MTVASPLTFEERVANALAEKTGVAPAKLAEHVEGLIAIGRYFRMSENDLLVWIRERREGMDWSLAKWRQHCVDVEEVRLQLAFDGSEQVEAPCLCPRCHTAALRVDDGLFFCSTCGEYRDA